MVKKVLVILVIFNAILFPFFSMETFRVHGTKTVYLKDSDEIQTAIIGMNDALAIFLPEDPVFLQGISIEMKIPKIAADYWDTIAYSFYQYISPLPSDKLIDYVGQCMVEDTLTGKLRMNFLIPTSSELQLKETPYSIILPNRMEALDVLLFRLQIIMKGVPESLGNCKFDLEVKPILSKKGRLQLEIEKDDIDFSQMTELPYTVFIDEQEPIYTNNNILLDSGMHHVAIVSEFYRNEIRNISIEQAKTTLLQIELKDIVPLLNISAPENTEVYIDDILCQDYSTSVPIEEGEHVIRFVLGGYENIQVIQVFKGKTYNVSVSLGVQITEE